MEKRMWKFLQLLVFVALISSQFAEAVNRCRFGEIPCGENECIPQHKWCDRKTDCTDGSDNEYCKPARLGHWIYDDDHNPNKCNSTHVLCKSGICFPLSVACDGYDNCGDNSDEENCLETVTQVPNGRHVLTSPYSYPLEDLFLTATYNTEMDYSKVVEYTSSPAIIKASETNMFETDEFSTPTANVYPHESSSLSYYELEMLKRNKPSSFLPRKSENGAQDSNNIENYNQNRNENSGYENGDARNRNFRYAQDVHSNSRGSVRPQTANGNNNHHNKVPTHANRASFPETRHYTQQPSTPRYHAAYPSSQKPSQNGFDRRQEDSDYSRRRTNNGRYNGRSYRGSYPYNNDRQNHYVAPRAESIYRGIRKQLPHFYFARNYNEEYAHLYEGNVRRGKEWIMKQRNRFDGWKKETHRAIVALSLINNNFVNTSENSMMKKQLEVYLGFSIMRNSSNPTTISLSRMALFINALIATCQDPRNFHGINLVDDLIKREREERGERRRFVNPIVYLSLCLADVPPEAENLRQLEMLLTPAFPNEESAKDMQILAITALSCYMQLPVLNHLDQSIRMKLNSAVNSLLSRRLPDGSFGSIYSTSLALQALFSLNTTVQWDPEKSLAYLREQQQADGSFGNFLATYYVLPVLSGRSLVHLRNTECDDPGFDREPTPAEILEYTGPKHHVRYSIYLKNPIENSYTVSMNVPIGTSIYDIMRVAEHLNDHFKFTYEKDNGNIFVTSITGIPNDSMLGFSWHLYSKRTSGEQSNLDNSERIVEDIGHYYPRESERIISWYHSTSIDG